LVNNNPKEWPEGLLNNNPSGYTYGMTTTQTPRPARLVLDSNGWAPSKYRNACTDEACPTCAGLGWVLCRHEGTGREFDPFNADGYTEWCDECSAPAEADMPVWAWCPRREG